MRKINFKSLLFHLFVPLMLSFIISMKLGLDYISCTRGAILHDFFTTDDVSKSDNKYKDFSKECLETAFNDYVDSEKVIIGLVDVMRECTNDAVVRSFYAKMTKDVISGIIKANDSENFMYSLTKDMVCSKMLDAIVDVSCEVLKNNKYSVETFNSLVRMYNTSHIMYLDSYKNSKITVNDIFAITMRAESSYIDLYDSTVDLFDFVLKVLNY